ncbi:hypothetical protein BCR37DRAFT_380588, partial [Protomyces lactucae-debilis]
MIGGFIASIIFNSLLLCFTTTATRAEGLAGIASGSKRPLSAVGAPSKGGVRPQKTNIPKTAIDPECRTVSIGYQHLYRKPIEKPSTAQQSQSIAAVETSVTSNLSPQSKPTPTLMLPKKCQDACKIEINAFKDQLLGVFRKYRHPANCWDTTDLTIIDRNGTAMEQFCPGKCALPVFCMCQLSLIVHHQHNATKAELKEAQRNPNPNRASICDMKTFPKGLGGAMKHSLFQTWEVIFYLNRQKY